MSHEEKALADYMSNLSEQSYCAGWMDGLEYVLWSAVVNGPREYGFLEITDQHVARLKELSKACGGWIIFDDERGETFVPIDAWLRLYETNQSRIRN